MVWRSSRRTSWTFDPAMCPPSLQTRREAFVEPLTSLEKTAEPGPFRDAVRRALAVLPHDDESETPT